MSDELERARALLADTAILAEARRPERRVVDAGAVVELLDRSTLKLDDEGQPTNIVEAVDRTLEQRPYLIGRRSGGGPGADQGARPHAENPLADLARLKQPRHVRQAVKRLQRRET